MGAHPPGANVGGRPRKLDREIQRLAEAAQHARTLLEQRHLAALMGEPCACEQRATAKALDDLYEVERRLRDLRQLAEPLEAGPGRRKRRRFSPDPWEVDVAQAAVALDRLMPGGEA